MSNIPIAPRPAFDAARIRADFPIFKLTVAGKRLVYLDNAASSQMPQPVIDRLVRYQTTEHANIHRAVHYLSETATAAYEAARVRLQHFINAREAREVIFTSGTTEGINLVAHGWGRQNIKAGDEIILTVLEHHSNIVPWQMLAIEKGAACNGVERVALAGQLAVDAHDVGAHVGQQHAGEGRRADAGHFDDADARQRTHARPLPAL